MVMVMVVVRVRVSVRVSHVPAVASLCGAHRRRGVRVTVRVMVRVRLRLVPSCSWGGWVSLHLPG